MGVSIHINSDENYIYLVYIAGGSPLFHKSLHATVRCDLTCFLEAQRTNKRFLKRITHCARMYKIEWGYVIPEDHS